VRGVEEQRYASALGARLRRVRQQQGLSLHDVEERSGGEFKASVVGAYERGERSVSITRLQRLATFYRVPIVQLLPDPGPAPDEDDATVLVIDLVALEQRAGDEPGLLRYVEAIKARRGDYGGEVLTLRDDDVQALAAVLDAPVDALRQRLLDEGIAR
jgi:transcriptional regulator with XRE-family HTH domain